MNIMVSDRISSLRTILETRISVLPSGTKKWNGCKTQIFNLFERDYYGS